jgi:hypothetical protein
MCIKIDLLVYHIDVLCDSNVIYMNYIGVCMIPMYVCVIEV